MYSFTVYWRNSTEIYSGGAFVGCFWYRIALRNLQGFGNEVAERSTLKVFSFPNSIWECLPRRSASHNILIGKFNDIFLYLIVFITFIVLILVGVLYLKTDTEPNQHKGVGNSTFAGNAELSYSHSQMEFGNENQVIVI